MDKFNGLVAGFGRYSSASLDMVDVVSNDLYTRMRRVAKTMRSKNASAKALNDMETDKIVISSKLNSLGARGDFQVADNVTSFHIQFLNGDTIAAEYTIPEL